MKTVEQRFWQRVDWTLGHGPDGDCWLWTGAVNDQGYGKLTVGAHRAYRAHRYSYELVHSPLEPGMCALHRCDVRRCVNPAHLFKGTRAVNNKDAAQKGRTRNGNRKGSAHPQSVLNESIVRRIWALRRLGLSVRVIAVKLEQKRTTIDGKRLRRSHNRATARQAIEIVSAWARTNRLTLGQIKVAEDSNEITAVPELLRVLAIKGCIVTVDALNTQKEMARQIRHQEADYVMALKGNHATLRDAVENLLTAVDEGRTWDIPTSEKRTVDGEHGRIETRRYVSVAALDWLPEKDQWPDLQSVGMVEARREIADKVRLQRRYYLSSLQVDAGKLEEAVRGHWSVENSLHWVLDVVFREDDSRVRVGDAAENFGLLTKIAHSLLQQERTAKVGVHNKRLKAALDQNYPLKVLNSQKPKHL